MNQKLLNHNFNILLSGVFVKSLGSGMYIVGAMILVLFLSGNPFYSGVAFFAVSLPSCFSFLISPLANYVSYKKALVACELTKSLLLLILPLLYVFSMLHVITVIIIMFMVALISTFTDPIETTLIPKFVGKKNVVKANSYINMLRESLVLVFLAIAGIIIAWMGSVLAIFITACCHLASSFLYLFFRIEAATKSKANASEAFNGKLLIQRYKHDLKEGFVCIRNTILPHIIAGAVIINFFTGSMFASIPAFSIMKGGSEAYYGYFMVAMTLGFLLGSFLTPRIKKLPYGALTISAAAFTGTFWLAASFVPVWYSLSFYCIGFIGVGVINILIFSLIQQQVENKMIGRVITILISISSIGQPFGALLGGAVSSFFSPVYPIIMAGVTMLSFSLYFLAHPLLRSLQSIDHLSLLKHPSYHGEKEVGTHSQ